MRVGALAVEGRLHLLHAHVLERGCAEQTEMIAFRDALRSQPELRAAHEAEQQRIIACGVRDGVEYAEIKGGFVRGVLG